MTSAIWPMSVGLVEFIFEDPVRSYQMQRRSIHSGRILSRLLLTGSMRGSAGTYLSLTYQRPCMQTVHTVLYRFNSETSTEIEDFRRATSMRLSSVLIIDSLRFITQLKNVGD